MGQYQDINLSDKQDWLDAVDDWSDGNYASAITSMKTDFTNKSLIASVINYITSAIVTLEQQDDPTFKADIIKVSATAPTLSTGQVYFKLI